MYQFVCVKWGTKYPADYVNRLFNMISRQTHGEFVLYCLTDNSEGLHPAIRPLPIVDNSLAGWWHKLSLFQSDFFGLQGDILFTDLDVVIVGGLDEFFSVAPGAFLITRDLATGAYNSSVFRFRIGSQAQIWESFQKQPDYVMKNFKGDQDWITETVTDAGLWPSSWVVSFKKQCNSRIPRSFGRIGVLLRQLGLMTVRGEAVIPDGARIVQFHGKPDPEDVIDGPYDIYRQAPWIREYWR
ncbi:hypothetical protein [Parathalassolituus penaei]|uniref:Glycosyltransferase n=1 Tax=Parathalassolituus penaei TaxID=2997323 RepID=A0A9X3EGM2_9GAMM|nr:hypothetical protein [Parathalassolituus penaei]MCY0966364.1 hypothetical protein [Parathalassolituus penaei]